MSNKYLEKVASLVRSPENIGRRMGQLGMAAANRLQRTKGIVLSNKGRTLYRPHSLPAGESTMEGMKRLTQTLDKLHAQPKSRERAVEETFKKTVGNNPNLFYR